MIGKNFYFQLIFRVVLITMNAVFLAFTWLNEYFYFFIAAFIFIVIQTGLLIRYLNQINYRLAYFFESIKNEDYTLRFSEEVKAKPLKALNKSLNRVNHLIRETQIKNRVQEKYYQEILSQASIGILTFNKKGHILFSNPTAKKLLNHEQLNHIKQLEQVDEKLYDILKELKAFERISFQFFNERENVQLVMKSSEIILNEEPLLLVVIQNIKNELDEKETDSWVRLIRVLTHEIMNTIAPITSISESILKYYNLENSDSLNKDLEEKRKTSTFKGLKVIQEQSNTLVNFVQSYRSLLNIPKPDKELIVIQNLFEKIKLSMSQQLKEKEIEFIIDVTPGNLEIFADEKQLSQVVLNLTKNAIQSVSGQVNSKIQLKAGLTAENKKNIEVIDNGSGIPPEIIDQVFIPFFTTKNDGTGIGLSLSKQILRLHGGSLDVKSSPGEETVFTLVF